MKKWLLMSVFLVMSVMQSYARQEGPQFSDQELAVRLQMQEYLQAHNGSALARLYYQHYCGTRAYSSAQVHAVLKSIQDDRAFNALLEYFNNPERCYGLLKLRTVGFNKIAYNQKINALLVRYGLDEGAQRKAYNQRRPVPSAPELPAYGPVLTHEQLDQQRAVIPADQLPDELPRSEPEQGQNWLGRNKNKLAAVVLLASGIFFLQR